MFAQESGRCLDCDRKYAHWEGCPFYESASVLSVQDRVAVYGPAGGNRGEVMEGLMGLLEATPQTAEARLASALEAEASREVVMVDCYAGSAAAFSDECDSSQVEITGHSSAADLGVFE